jgi:hypothetical protein
MYVLILTQRGHFGYLQPPFISPLSLGFALHTIEEGVFCREMINTFTKMGPSISPIVVSISRQNAKTIVFVCGFGRQRAELILSTAVSLLIIADFPSFILHAPQDLPAVSFSTSPCTILLDPLTYHVYPIVRSDHYQ